MLRSARVQKNKLLGAEDGVFRGFGDAELHDALGLDLDLFAGLRIAADAGGAVFQDELADARQCERILRMLVREGGDLIEDFDGLFFGKTVFLGDERGDLSFGECFSHIFVLLGCCYYLFVSPKNQQTDNELKSNAPAVQAKKAKKSKFFTESFVWDLTS